jgi:hypothetical protein
MSQLFIDNPWLVVCILAAAVTVICTAIVFITDYLRRSHQAEIDASLKQDMLSRGLSAADIKAVLEASTGPYAEGAESLGHANQVVRVGLGKFQVEVGGANKPTQPVAESQPARG